MSSDAEKLFKDYLLKLANDDFYSLVYNYLHDCSQNVYNKHDLIQKLVQFLKDKHIQEILLSYVDLDDRLILTTIYFFENFSVSQLHSILPHIPYSEILQKIRNLCERLLLIYTRNQIPILNPILSDFFNRLKLDRQYLTRIVPSKTVYFQFWLTESLIIFCLSFSLHRKTLSENSSEWKLFFPSTIVTYVKLLFEAFVTLDLIDHQKRPILKNLENFTQLSSLSRLCHLLAAYITRDPRENLIIFKVLSYIFTHYQNCLCMPGFFERTYFLLQGSLPSSSVIERFEHCGIGDMVQYGRVYVASCSQSYQYHQEEESSLTLESDCTALLSTQSNFILGLCLAFEPVSYDVVIRFQLNKQSLFYAIESGYTIEKLMKSLANHLVKPFPNNFIDYLTRLEQNMRRAQLYEGYFLKLDTALVHRLSSSVIFNKMTLEISSGVYWIKDFSSVEFFTELKNAGIDTPLRYRPDLNLTHTFWDLTLLKEFRLSEIEPYDSFDQELCEKRLTNLKNLAKTAEQKIRISQRVILHEEQLKGSGTSNNICIQSTDYNYKINVIQHALQVDLYLEVVLMWKEAHKTLIVIPKHIEKQENGAILMGINHITQKPVKLRIQKLFSVSTFKPTLLHHYEH